MKVKIRFKESGATGTLDVQSKEDMQQQIQQIMANNPGSELEVVGDMAASAARGGWQGASLNLGDELAGVGAALVPGGQGYTEARDEARLLNHIAQQSNPKTYAVSEFGGGMIIPGGGAAKAAKGLNKLQKAGRYALAGGLGGAATGFGHGEGTQESLTGAAAGGAAGALLGPVLGAGTEKAADLIGDAAQGARRLMWTDPRESAERWVRKNMDPAIDSPDILKGAVSAQGPDSRLVDVDEGMLRMAQQSKLGGAASDRIIAQNMNPVRDRAVDRMRDEIRRSMPDVQTTPQGLKRFINDKTSTRQVYDAAYAKDFVPDEWVQRQFDHSKTWRTIADDVGESMLDRDIDRLSIRDIDELPGQVPVEYMHRFLAAMRGKVSKLYREGDTHAAKQLQDVHRKLDLKVKEQVPEFAEAQKFYRTKMELDDAVDFGRNIYRGKVQPDQLDDILADFNESEMVGFRSGLLQAMLDQAGEVTQTGNTGNKVFANRRVQDVIRKGMDDPVKFEELLSHMSREQRKARAHTRLLNQSPTAQIQQGDKRLPEGGVMGMMRSLFDRLVGQEMTPAEWQEVSKILTGKLSEKEINRIFATRVGEFMSPVPEAIGTATAIGTGQLVGREY